MVYPLFLGDVTAIPTSTFIVTLLAVGVNLLFGLGRRFLTNVKETRRIQAELRAYQKELRQAVMSKNKTKQEKLKKKKPQMDRLQAKMMTENLRLMLMFFIPLIGVWWLIPGWVGGYEQTVAVSPIPFNLLVIYIQPQLNFFWWYIISSFALSGIITKALGVSITD